MKFDTIALIIKHKVNLILYSKHLSDDWKITQCLTSFENENKKIKHINLSIINDNVDTLSSIYF